jgi:hypothetical protein
MPYLDDMNLHALTHSCPIDAVDPTGQYAVEVLFGAFIPRKLGTAIVGATDEKERPYNWILEPYQISGAGWYMFNTNDRDTANILGTNKLESAASIRSEQIGRLVGPVFSASSGGSLRVYVTGHWGLAEWSYDPFIGDVEEKTDPPKFGDDVSNCPVSKSCIDHWATAQYAFSSRAAPNIDYKFRFCIDRRFTRDGDEVINWDVNGTHNLFPAYELFVDGKLEYEYLAEGQSGPGLINLNSTMSFSARGAIVVETPRPSTDK